MNEVNMNDYPNLETDEMKWQNTRDTMTRGEISLIIK